MKNFDDLSDYIDDEENDSNLDFPNTDNELDELDELLEGLEATSNATGYYRGKDGKYRKHEFSKEEINAILSGKNPKNVIKKIFDKKDQNVVGIMNNHFKLYLMNKINIPNDNNAAAFLFECAVNKPHPTLTLFDAYEYLKNTKFLHFLIAYQYGNYIWSENDISMQMHIKDEVDMRGNKIFITVITNKAPKWISEVEYTFCQNNIKINTKFAEIPIIERSRQWISMDKPAIRYEIVLGLEVGSITTFTEINLDNLYIHFISPYIEEAISHFYPVQAAYTQNMQLNENSVNSIFSILNKDNLLCINIICAPAIIPFNESYHHYEYYDENIHLISENPAPDYGDIYSGMIIGDNITYPEDPNELFLTRICSSKDSQILFSDAYDMDIIVRNGEYFRGIKFDTCKFINSYKYPVTVANDEDIYGITEIFSANDVIQSYWKINGDDLPTFDNDDETTSILFAFLNCKYSETKFNNLYELLIDDTVSKEINMIYNVDIKFLLDREMLGMREVYRDDDILRLSLWAEVKRKKEPILTSETTNEIKNTQPSKKSKFRIFDKLFKKKME